MCSVKGSSAFSAISIVIFHHIWPGKGAGEEGGRIIPPHIKNIIIFERLMVLA